MEQQLDKLGKNDLHLRFARRRSSRWEVLPSKGKYIQSVVHHEFLYGNIYTQGVFVDASGNSLSHQALSELIVRHGYKVVDFLEGDFVIAVDDKRHGIWCATDHSATLPLYYNLESDQLVITTRAENLKVTSANDLNIECIIAVLSSGYPWGDQTLLKNWKVIRPGHILRINGDDVASHSSYFDPEKDVNVLGYQTPEELIAGVDTSLKSIASRYKRILLPLSGGIDSRLIAVRCQALGIPFEAITFVANVPSGADFDIATRLAKVFDVKHHRWEWDPTVESCIQNFSDFCIATGGTNDAYTSYPDAMGIFGQVASGFDCIMRGDHVFGLGPYSDTMSGSAYLVAIKLSDDMNWTLRTPSKNTTDIISVFEAQEGVSANTTGPAANAWRHESYRKSRSPRYILPIAQFQAQYTEVTYPFLTKEIISRVSRSEASMRNSKRIAHEAVAAGSPPNIRQIPFANQPTWKNGEPMLSLPSKVINEMIEIAGKEDVLSEIVDEALIVANYKSFLNRQKGGQKQRSLMSSLKQMVKGALPEALRSVYQDRARQNAKAPPYMIFKRYFAMKAFLRSIS